MEGLIRKKGTVALRKVDIARWNSEVAEQFGIRSIPQLWLYEGTRQVSRDSRRILDQLQP